ncbi:DNA polymerase I [Butyrivibrio sp. INlla18]|uniref:DNA polymerase I n=1 Tax=Butyrivibrio sp. INlla18 TaxID=1520806 RepID=UPI00088BEF6A|nr:DNA polymerase I [Butyrivibrio sp. INlla18]SDA51600.1 DNA polymerase I [Butyrivibrio sp. INlla18]
MSENLLIVNGNELISDAFYKTPAFTNSEGVFVNGVYGGIFKLISILKTSEYKALSISFSEECGNERLKPQILKFKEIIEAKGQGEIPVTKELLESLENALKDLSPSGEVKGASFDMTLKVTSDLNEVEALFETKSDRAAFYFLTDIGDFLGLGISFDGSNVTYIPVENFITADYLGKKLSILSERMSLCSFDIKESYKYFEPSEFANRTYGYKDEDVSGNKCFDVLIGAYLINPLKNDYEPWDVAKEYLKLTLPKRADLFGKEPLANADIKVLSEYASKIAYICFNAEPLIRAKLAKTGMERLMYNIEMPLSYILYSMEKEGIIVKRDELKAYGDKLLVRIDELEKAIYEAAGIEFNINSPKQLGEILFEKLGLPAEKKTKSGYSTAADVLEKLAPEHKIVADILEYRGLTKLKSTYADGLAAYIADDNRIHTSFNQTITATGRISSTEPNLQNIPMRTELGRLIRKVFVPKDGYVFADADYSQIELRILAHMSEDKGLIEAYHEGKDIHRITASKVFHVPFEEVTSLQRRNAKAVNFGIVYGISAFGLSQDLSISAHEAKEYMEKYFETYPGVKKYQEDVIASTKAKGYSETMFGRRRPVPELKASNFNLRQFGERVAMNAPIQGTAADIMKIAMIDVFFKLKELSLKSKLILQIHDELVIETAPDEVDTVTKLLVEEMEKAVTLSVPMEVDCHIGSDWYEAK